MSLIRELWRRHPGLAFTGLAMLALTPVLALGMVLDPRDFNGAPLWLKPAKFALSEGVYFVTLAWFFGYVRPAFARSGWGASVAWIGIATGLFELVYITWRASRGEASHFNVSTPVTTLLYSVMGIAALLLTAVSAVLAVGVARGDQPIGGAYRLSVVLGLWLGFLLGAGVGVLLGGMGSHWIGGERSDLHGLPGFEWSTTGGDLRIAHFFGLHAVQTIPLIGLLVNRLRPSLGRAVVVLFALAWTAFVVWLAAEALAGRPPWTVFAA